MSGIYMDITKQACIMLGKDENHKVNVPRNQTTGTIKTRNPKDKTIT